MIAKKSRVVILGSKPGAIIPEGEAIYCANGVIGYYIGGGQAFFKGGQRVESRSCQPERAA